MSVAVFRSRPSDCVIHPCSSWVELDDEWEITSLPIYDAHECITAAMGRGPAIAWCEARGYELPTADDMRRLHKLSHYVAPVTLPTTAMLMRDGVPRPWFNADGSDTPHMARYRASNMMGIEWARLHDYEVWMRLAASRWDGVAPVANFGKQWVKEGVFGWRLPNGTFIQDVSKFHDSNPDYDDYGTDNFAKRRKVRRTMTTVPDTIEVTGHPTLRQGDHDPEGSTGGPVRTLQRMLLHAGAVLPRYGADGDMRGTETVDAVRAFQRRVELSVTGVADAETWAELERLQTPWVPGIDVSSNQALAYFDWAEIAKVQRWVIARATYGGRDFGSKRQHKRGADPIFVDVVGKARAAGMMVGAYHFFRQGQTADEQLGAFFAQLDKAGIGDGDIVPMIDLEDNQTWDGPLDAKAHHTAGRAMVEAVAERYGRAAIYTAPYHPINLGLSASSWMLEHDIWIADPTNWAKGKGCPRWPDGWSIWQIGAEHIVGYADVGHVKGIGHVIDVNLARSLPIIGC